jgi:hypothetical protein
LPNKTLLKQKKTQLKLVVRYEHYFATKNISVRRQKSYAPLKKSVRHNIVTNEFGCSQIKTTKRSQLLQNVDIYCR